MRKRLAATTWVALLVLAGCGGRAPDGPPEADLPEGPRSWLGIQAGPYEPGQSPGVFVERVVPGSPAERAGLAPRDVIVRVNGYPTEESGFRLLDTDIMVIVSRQEPGTVLDLVVERNGQLHTAEVVLGEPPQEPEPPTQLPGGEGSPENGEPSE